MIDQVIAEGNDITFGNIQFRCQLMPKREGFKIMEKFRVFIPQFKSLLLPILTKSRANQLTPREGMEFFLDGIGVLDTELVEHIQEKMFAYVDFRASENGEFLSLNPMVDEMAFADMSYTELYILMGRCIWVNFQRDIAYWSEIFKRKMLEAAAQENEEAEGDGVEG